jgi:regulator of protease activity HflC (stomatin/prohibitin superfamily)
MDETNFKPYIKWGIRGALGLLGLVVALNSFTVVDTGFRGVKTTFGEVQGSALPEGLYFKIPVAQKIIEIDTRIQKWSGDTFAYTGDTQQAKVFFVLNYRLDPAEAATTYRDVGVDWAYKLVGQVVHENLKKEFGQFKAVDIVANRDKVARNIETSVTSILLKRGVVVSSFQLTNIDYTDQFEKAVEAKVVAQQDAIREQNRTVQIKEQATQKIETAKGDAEATVLSATAKAEATVLNARAEAESIQIRAKALEQNPKLVEWEAVKQWDGRMPQFVMGEGGMPLIQIPTNR